MAAEVIISFLDREGLLMAPGQRVFRTPEEWIAQGEEYAEHSLLVVVHDGGSHAPAFAWEYEDYELIDALDAELRPLGVFVVQCTTWYSAVHALQDRLEEVAKTFRKSATEAGCGVVRLCTAPDRSAGARTAVRKSRL